MSRSLLQRTRGLAGSFVLLAITAAPLHAQSVSEVRPYYDIKEETTISGTVASVVTKATPGMIAGSHLLLHSAFGEIDASLGRWGLTGKNAMVVTAGKSVEVTGVMKTLHERQVFVVRTVKMGGETYTMRNEHGIPMSPQSRERAGQKGGSL